MKLYSLDDITIIPSIVTTIRSRRDCNPYITENLLPLYASPMGSIVDETNYDLFHKEGIRTIIPRTVDWEIRKELALSTWTAFSLEEVELLLPLITNNKSFEAPFWFICIDVANGHMTALLEACKALKETHRAYIMTGCIANPNTYFEYAKTGVDVVRIGIGGGSVCTTSANTGVHYPMGSLIRDTYLNKELIRAERRAHPNSPYKWFPSIVADGGLGRPDLIIKALALGADSCMCGSIFVACEEACGEIKSTEYSPVKYREYYGMSTKKAQKEMGNGTLKTAEGISQLVVVKYPLKKWVENFTDNLRSAMSYSNAIVLEQFIGKANTQFMTDSSFKSYYK